MYLVSQHSTGAPPDRTQFTIVDFEYLVLDLQRKRFTPILIFLLLQ